MCKRAEVNFYLDNKFESFGQLSLKYFYAILILNFCEVKYQSLELLSLLQRIRSLSPKFEELKNSLAVKCIKKAWGKEINAVIPDKIWSTVLSHMRSCGDKG